MYWERVVRHCGRSCTNNCKSARICAFVFVIIAWYFSLCPAKRSRRPCRRANAVSRRPLHVEQTVRSKSTVPGRHVVNCSFMACLGDGSLVVGAPPIVPGDSEVSSSNTMEVTGTQVVASTTALKTTGFGELGVEVASASTPPLAKTSSGVGSIIVVVGAGLSNVVLTWGVSGGVRG